MQSRTGINLRKASRPRRKFLALMAMAVISVALMGLAAPAPAEQVTWSINVTLEQCEWVWDTFGWSYEHIYKGDLTGTFVADTGSQTITNWDLTSSVPGLPFSTLNPGNSRVVSLPGAAVPVFEAVNDPLRLQIRFADGNSNMWTQSDISVALDDVFTYDDLYGLWSVTFTGGFGSYVRQLPIAKAGDDQTVHAGALVYLDGSGSYIPSGQPWLISGYFWEITEKPPGSAATLYQNWTPQTRFYADKMGDYRVKLIVSSTNGDDSAPSTVTISTSNSAPVADAGPDQAVLTRNTLVTLDGRASYDVDGDNPLNYSWTFLNKPAESQAALSDQTASQPTFTADIEGTYVIGLQVTDKWGAPNNPQQGKPTVTVSFDNVAPVANAGGNQSKVVGDTVFLDGSGSSDANLDPLTYQWSLSSWPGSTNSPPTPVPPLSGTNNTTASFVADLPGDYMVSLTVSDGIASNSQNITITVLTKQDAATENLTTTVDVLNNISPTQAPDVFVNTNMQNALTNKINAALKLIDQGQYALAVDKLQNDILPKTDGCATQGAPDKNDWIKDCATQQQVYAFVNQTINLLQGLQ